MLDPRTRAALRTSTRAMMQWILDDAPTAAALLERYRARVRCMRIELEAQR